MNEENVVYICKMHNQWEFAIRCWELNLALCYKPRDVEWGGR